MTRIVCDEIRFDSLSKEVQQALNLLFEQKGKAAEYWRLVKETGGRGSFFEAYGLNLGFRTWNQFKTGIKGYPYEGPDIPPDFDAIEKMMELGWTSKLYDALMEWTECRDLMPAGGGGSNILIDAEHNNRRVFLVNFLSEVKST